MSSALKSSRAFSAVLILAAATASQAEPIVIGGTARGNVFPFGVERYLGSYQQVYTAAAFAAPTTILQIAFMGSTLAPLRGGTVESTFSIGLSTTSAEPSSLAPSYSQNRGTDFRSVFS